MMELLDEAETGTALSLALSIDSEGPVLDLEARFVISFRSGQEPAFYGVPF